MRNIICNAMAFALLECAFVCASVSSVMAASNGSIVFTNGMAIMETFDAAPFVGQWSTRIWPGSSVDISNATALHAAAVTNDASLINMALGMSGDNPPAPAQTAVWSSTGKYIQTRPQDVAYEGIMASLLNDS